MAKELGVNVLLFVQTGLGPPPVYEKLLGQQTTGFNGSTGNASTTDKDSRGWQTAMPATIGGEVSAEGQINWADPAFRVLFAAWKALQPVNCEIVFNAAGEKMWGPFAVSWETGGAVEEATTYNFTLTPTEALDDNFETPAAMMAALTGGANANP